MLIKYLILEMKLLCGICGVYGIEDKSLIKRMLKITKHRGPDDCGVYLNTKIALGHNRLSIIDLSKNASQPMSNENEDIWLVANGEIYNFRDLRSKLEKKGHQFHSKSDSEVIIHAYEEYGIYFVNYLRGMFSIAIYDEKQDILILVRDPIGKKPLYYYYNEDILLFASEIKAILEAEIPKKMDENGLLSYLSYSYVPGKKTLFCDINKILPGEMIIYDGTKIKIRKYWDLKENLMANDENYFKKKLRGLLEESIKIRMIADVPIGAFLSGGIDSSAMVALARPHVDNFHTYSLGFENFSELAYAEMVSNHLNTTHHEIIINEDMVLKDLEKIAWHYDEPMGDAAIINNYYLAQEASKKVKVVLAGEGGDELFGGYEYFKRNMNNKFNNIPNQFKHLLKKSIGIIPKGDVTSVSNNLYRLIDSYMCQPNIEKTHIQTTRIMHNYEIDYLLSKKMVFSNDIVRSSHEMKEPLNKMLSLDCKNLLPERFLMKADKATMANSLEERVPLLDKNVIEFAFKIPPNFKIFKHNEKYILRQAVKDFLPSEIIERKKQGFGTPIGSWLYALKDSCSETLTSGELVNTILDKNIINKYLNNLNKGNINIRFSKILWSILALEIWYQIYISEN